MIIGLAIWASLVVLYPKQTISFVQNHRHHPIGPRDCATNWFRQACCCNIVVCVCASNTRKCFVASESFNPISLTNSIFCRYGCLPNSTTCSFLYTYIQFVFTQSTNTCTRKCMRRKQTQTHKSILFASITLKNNQFAVIWLWWPAYVPKRITFLYQKILRPENGRNVCANNCHRQANTIDSINHFIVSLSLHFLLKPPSISHTLRFPFLNL